MLKDILLTDGVIVKRDLISSREASELYNNTWDQIQSFASELNCSISSYLSCASRWGSNSALLELSEKTIEQKLRPLLENEFSQPLNLVKTNIISKTPFAPYAIPCHQDISYQDDTRYDFTVWLALNDVSSNDGTLICLPKSHLTAISAAPDFWQPDYRDTMLETENWKKNALAYPVSRGSAVIFDCRCWHGSLQSTTSVNRLTLVTRWAFTKNKRTFNIPQPKQAAFGMWNCNSKTISYLKQIVNRINKRPEKDFIALLDQVANIIPTLGFIKNHAAAIKALQQVKLLHMASLVHNAGDSQGRIYANLWHHLLQHLTGI